MEQKADQSVIQNAVWRAQLRVGLSELKSGEFTGHAPVSNNVNF
jgi:hypothetical protein